jgi:hypothetical protein
MALSHGKAIFLGGAYRAQANPGATDTAAGQDAPASAPDAAPDFAPATPSGGVNTLLPGTAVHPNIAIQLGQGSAAQAQVRTPNPLPQDPPPVEPSKQSSPLNWRGQPEPTSPILPDGLGTPVQLPVIPGSDLAARRTYVKNGAGAIFKIDGNPSANSTAPLFEINAFNSVNKYASAIDTAAKKWHVEPDLIRSVMYMEQTHGYYDALLEPFDMNHTILPMNVHDTLWGNFVGTRKQLLDPAYNIDAGAKILASIQANLAPEDTTVDKIATLYNKLGATQVTDYGARVNAIYTAKPWIQK